MLEQWFALQTLQLNPASSSPTSSITLFKSPNHPLPAPSLRVFICKIGVYFLISYTMKQGFPGGSVVKNPPANAADTGTWGLISGAGISPGGRNGCPFQYSCRENPIDRGLLTCTTGWSLRCGFLSPKSLVAYLHIQQKCSAGRLVWMSTLISQLTGMLRTCFGRWPGSWRISIYLESVSEWNTLNSNSKHVSIRVAFYKAFSSAQLICFDSLVRPRPSEAEMWGCITLLLMGVRFKAVTCHISRSYLCINCHG